jgi:DNA-binding MarR family transcriptional regulator
MTRKLPQSEKWSGQEEAPVRRRVFLSSKEQLEAGSTQEGTVDHVIRDSLGHATTATARLFDRALTLRLRRYGVPLGQWSLLLALWAKDGVSQRVLSDLAAIDEGTVARTVDRMVRDGLVRRLHSKIDKRQYEVVLTTRGRELRDYLIIEAERVNEEAKAALTDDELAQLLALLAKIRSNLENRLDK